MKLLVTGAGGYIGARVVAGARAAGHEVIAAGRRPVPGAAWQPFDLMDTRSLALSAGVDAVLHLAADTSGGSDSARQEAEVAAAGRLLAAAAAAGARMVFVSSQTARADAPTAYGRSKWRIEQLVLAAGGAVVRPGQVYGGPPRGLYGTLVETVRQLPLLPAFVPAPRIQPVHVDDLAQALLAVARRKDAGGRIYRIGAAQPVDFTAFLRAIARHRLGVVRLFVPVPSVLVTVARRAAGARVAALERLGSLFALPPMDTAADLQELDLHLRPLVQGLARGGRRLLLRECAVLLRYVLAQPAPAALVRRQARAVQRLRGGTPLPLPALALNAPATLRWLEGRAADGASGREFAWRLDCATAIAEASPLGARRFLGVGEPVSRIAAVAALAAAVAAEVLWRIGGIAMRPLLRWP